MHKHPLLYINFALLAVIVLLILGVNANNLNLPQPLKVLAQTASQIISGTGTPTSMAQFTGSYTLGNSQIYQDGAGRIGIGTQNPSSAYKLDVVGNARTLDTWLDRANSGAGAWASTLSAPSTISWNSITGKPAGFADNVDNDTTYTAGAGLTLSGTTFSAASAVPHGKQRFISNGTFTVPAGVTRVWVTMSGGGGGGGNGGSGNSGAGGGGGGAHAVIAQQVSVTSGQNIAITIGNGGTSGSAGGNSLFGGFISANGGGGGSGNSGTIGGSGGAAGGSGGSSGENGEGSVLGKSINNGGTGGGSIFGSGGGGTGATGSGYGGGGAGGSGGSGGAGAPGFVLVEW